MSKLSSETVMQGLRIGIVVGLVVVMAAASSGALGALAWTSGPPPPLPIRQTDNADNSGPLNQSHGGNHMAPAYEHVVPTVALV